MVSSAARNVEGLEWVVVAGGWGEKTFPVFPRNLGTLACIIETEGPPHHSRSPFGFFRFGPLPFPPFMGGGSFWKRRGIDCHVFSSDCSILLSSSATHCGMLFGAAAETDRAVSGEARPEGGQGFCKQRTLLIMHVTSVNYWWMASQESCRCQPKLIR